MPLNNNPYHGHQWLILCMQAIGLNPNPEGVCFGFYSMASHAVLLNEIEEFGFRLRVIYDIYQTCITQSPDSFPQQFKEAIENLECQRKLDIEIFLQNMTVYQSPHDHPHLLLEDLSAFLEQDTYHTKELLQPERIASQGGIAKSITIMNVFTLPELNLMIELFKLTLSGINYPVIISIKNINHSIGIGYQPTIDKWQLINASAIPMIIQTDSNALTAQWLYDSSKSENDDHTVITLEFQVIAINREALLQRFASLSHNPLWNSLAVISPTKVMAMTSLGDTLLRRFVRSKQSLMTQQLLNVGANPDIKNKIRGTTILHDAAALDLAVIIEQLVASGADINARDLNGETPLQLAASCNAFNALSTLLKLKADPYLVDNNDLSALHKTVTQGNHATTSALLSHPNINIRHPNFKITHLIKVAGKLQLLLQAKQSNKKTQPYAPFTNKFSLKHRLFSTKKQTLDNQPPSLKRLRKKKGDVENEKVYAEKRPRQTITVAKTK